jgi:Domain of unknown function (DUF5642)
VVSTGVRLLDWAVAVLVLTTACGGPSDTAQRGSSTATSSPAQSINPSNIKRVRGALPPGYEVADFSGPPSPAGLWGFRPGWAADPPQCAALAQPAGDTARAQGLSGSGAGGIVYAVVTAAPATLDPALLGECGRWSMTYGHTTAAVRLTDPPHIDGVDTLGMTSTIRTVVESGTETDSQAQTFTAYLGDYVAFVTLVTDPGSPHPPLEPGFAADLLVRTVSALRVG